MLRLYKPSLEDLWSRQTLMEDLSTMSYNAAWGGTILFPKEKWGAWYDKWLIQHNNERFYRYLFHEETQQYVGEVAYHLDASRKIHLADIVVSASCRKRGYGTEGLKLLCRAAKENGMTALYDEIAAGNPSVNLFLNNGFIVEHQTAEIIMVKRTL